jgi:hypothetical protein
METKNEIVFLKEQHKPHKNYEKDLIENKKNYFIALQPSPQYKNHENNNLFGPIEQQ